MEDAAGQIGTVPWPVVAGERPQIAGLGAPRPGIEHRCRRLVHEQLARLLEQFGHARHDRRQMARRPSDPIGQDRAVEDHAAALEQLPCR